jgi:hypothetical protein
MTRMTIAAFPIVEATDGTSTAVSVWWTWLKGPEVGILTHANNITGNIVTEGKISSNSYQNVYRAGRTDTGANDSSCSVSDP